MNMELITSAASDALVNVVLAIIALAGAYGVYYIRLGAAKLKEQTAQIKDEAGRKVLEDALDDVVDIGRGDLVVVDQRLSTLADGVLPIGGLHIEKNKLLGEQIAQHAITCPFLACAPRPHICGALLLEPFITMTVRNRFDNKFFTLSSRIVA